jgi:hypothetical protein
MSSPHTFSAAETAAPLDTGGVTQEISDRLKALHRLVGNTPLLAIDVRYRGSRGASTPSTSR